MEFTLIVAKALGIYLVISGLFLLLRGKTVPKLLADFFGHPAFVYLTGAILVIFSSVFLLDHNLWDGTWKTVITIFAWAVFIKGVAYIFVPETLHNMVSKKLLGTLNIYGVIAIIAGVMLYYVV